MKKIIILSLLFSACGNEKMNLTNDEVESEVYNLINSNREKIKELEKEQQKRTVQLFNSNQTTESGKSNDEFIEEEQNIIKTDIKKEDNSYNSSEYNKYHDDALTLLINGNLNQALVKINEAIKINPNKADSYYVRGNIYQKKGYLNIALTDFLKTLEINPNHSDAAFKSAIVYGKLNNKSMFCYYMEKACDLGDSDACEGHNEFCN